ncbi:hypothetical protein M3Y95_01159200 [Aphelenchoides besseyi]|nr:hypothetical protein M3Y95_01159200 [Aphelenchoides besseyi]
MGNCNHKPMLQLTDSWEVSESEEFWKTEDQTLRSQRLWFPFRPETKFRLMISTRGGNWARIDLLYNGQFDEEDYDCYFWVEQNGEIIAGANDRPTKIERFILATHGYEAFKVHYKVVFTKSCPLCAGAKDEQVEQVAEDPIQELKEEHQLLDDKILIYENEHKKLAAQVIELERAVSRIESRLNEEKKRNLKSTRIPIAQLKRLKLSKLEQEDQWKSKVQQRKINELENALKEANDRIYNLESEKISNDSVA